MNTLIQYPYAKWCMVMFPYGAYRQWKCEIREPFDLYGHRVLGSCINGIYYMTPLGFVKMFDFIEHVEYFGLETIYGDNDEGYLIYPYCDKDFSIYKSFQTRQLKLRYLLESR